MTPVPDQESKLSHVLTKTMEISKPSELKEGSDPRNLPIFAIVACLRNNVDRVVGLVGQNAYNDLVRSEKILLDSIEQTPEPATDPMVLRILELTHMHVTRVLELIFLSEKTSDLTSRIGNITARLDRAQKINTVLQKDVKLDPLTKLYNKEGFDEEGLRVFEYCKENRIPLSCLYVDLDYFKLINDRYGQDIGDDLLKAFSQMLREEFREYDVAFQGNFDSPPVVGRDGGEEFVILSPYTNLEEAAVAAERLRKRVQDHVFELINVNGEAVSINITCSIGVSQVDFEQDKNVKVLKRHSNIAVKEGKNEYRNVVAVRKFDGDKTIYDYSSLKDPKRKPVPKIGRDEGYSKKKQIS